MQEFNQGVYDYIIATDESNEAMEPDSGGEVDADEDADATEQIEGDLI